MERYGEVRRGTPMWRGRMREKTKKEGQTKHRIDVIDLNRERERREFSQRESKRKRDNNDK